VSEDLGHKLEKTELSQLGSVKKVTVTKDDTIMLHGGGEGACLGCRVQGLIMLHGGGMCLHYKAVYM
jgi:chaperonin GroEL